MKRFFTFLGLSTIFLLCCASSISFKVMIPALVNLPADIKSIAIIDRSEFVNNVNNQYSLDDSALYNEAALIVVDGLISVMRNSPRYKIVRTSEKIKGSDTENNLPTQISWDQINELCTKYKVDAILSLENLDPEFTMTRETRLQTQEYNQAGNLIIPRNEARVVATVNLGFRVYAPHDRKIVDEYEFYQDRKWVKTGNTPDEASNGLIGKADAIKEVSYNSGIVYAKRITPAWITVSRNYYRQSNHDPDIVKGANMMENQDWQRAITAFERSIENGNKKTRGKASHDLAVVYEILGDLDKAINYANDACQKYRNKPSREYLDALIQRKKDQERLNDQLRRN